jgi:putative membrane-bound dehydrogenase-like protein
MARRLLTVLHVSFFARLLIGSIVASCFVSAAPSPADTVDRLVISDLIEARLWVAEPFVVDPVALCFDEAGVAYVAECRDYPYGAGEAGKVGSTIRRLEDRDGDGTPERVTLFAGDLSYATSVTPWRGGVLVAAAPDIVFLKDTNGDGVADVRQVVLTGFDRGVSDSLVNGLRYHLDGRIHGANGGSGGTISSPKLPDLKVDLDNHDFAFNPDTGDIELTAQTSGGFGLVFDDWGRAFTTHNINHLQHRLLPRRHVAKNPGFPPINTTVSISDHGDMAAIFPVSTPQTRPNHPEQSGHFSSAGGMGYVGSPAWGPELYGSMFVCDVVGNLVHRDVVSAGYGGFKASRAAPEENREFIASRDPAFRPVGLEVGPDGALYLLDMQRDVIEHPDYIPAKMREKIDIRAGSDRGRIYRLTPKGGLPPARTKIAKADPAELIGFLASQNQWVRLTAQRLILERGLRNLAPQLREIAFRAPEPLARLHALWTLRGLGELGEKDVVRACGDANPGVRENVLILAEQFLPQTIELHEQVVRLARDPDSRVRFQAAQTLGLLQTDAATGALQMLFVNDRESREIRLAALSSIRLSDARMLLFRYLQMDGFRFAQSAATIPMLQELGELVGARAGLRPDDAAWLIGQIDSKLTESSRVALLEGLDAGLARSGARINVSSTPKLALGRLSMGASASEQAAVLRLCRRLKIPLTPSQERALATALATTTNASLSAEKRLEALPLLQFSPPGAVTNALATLLSAEQPAGIPPSAFTALTQSDPPGLGDLLVRTWPSIAPDLRARVVAWLVEKKAHHAALLGGLESGALKVGELNLDLEQRRRLLREADPEIRKRAAKFVSDEEYANRKAVVDDWLTKLPAEGNRDNGRKVFEAVCSRCHRMDGLGVQVGPDLAGSAHRSVEDLLSNILDPNMAMNPGFTAYVAETRDGENPTGLLAAQSTESITLLQASDQRVVVPRTKLVALRSTGQSLMPEGLEAGRTPADLRDLIAFLQGR